MGSQLYDAFVDACDDIKKLEGVADTFDPCPTIVCEDCDNGGGDDDDGGDGDDDDDGGDGDDDDDGGDGGNGDDDDGDDQGDDDEGDDDGDGGAIGIIEDKSPSQEDDSMAAGAIFGILFAALVALALLALFLRRRRRNGDDMLKHRSFEDDVGDETFMLNGDSPSRSLQDGDSRFGMYPEGRKEGMMLGDRALNQDVHKCSSATCELCEQRRQSGLQFLPTKTSPNRARMSLADSKRTYGAEDTVNL